MSHLRLQLSRDWDIGFSVQLSCMSSRCGQEEHDLAAGCWRGVQSLCRTLSLPASSGPTAACSWSNKQAAGASASQSCEVSGHA